MTPFFHVVLAVACGAALLAPTDAVAVNPLATTATYYDPSLHGSVMANGQVYDRWNPAIAACNWYPIGTLLRVTHQETGSYIYVRVTDRGSNRLTLDLSEAGFGQLGRLRSGRIPVWVEIVTSTDAQHSLAPSLRKDDGPEAEIAADADAATSSIDALARLVDGDPSTLEQGAWRLYTAADPLVPTRAGPPRYGRTR